MGWRFSIRRHYNAVHESTVSVCADRNAGHAQQHHAGVRIVERADLSACRCNPRRGLGQGVFTVDRHLGSGYIQQWIGHSRAVTPNLTFEIAYVGSKATHSG